MNETAQRPRAYSYQRFSTPDQLEGDSLRRQLQGAQEYARRKGLDLDTELTFQDLGVSAWRGKNLETGQLGAFLEAAKSGLVEPGSYLLVEHLDRVSRKKARKAVRILEDIVEEGITVVTLNDEKEWTEESLDGMDFLIACVYLMKANDESEQKSRRLKAAWEDKREVAAEELKPVTARCPGWLKLNRKRTKYEPIPERVEVVKRIFSMFLQGYGYSKIAETLNAEGVEPWGLGRQKSDQWHRTYISKVLRNRAVLGEYEPHSMEEDGDRQVRKAREPIPGYYPQVIDDDTFATVAMVRRSKAPKRGRHAHTATQNAFAGLLECNLCGGTVTRVHKGARSSVKLVCRRAKDRVGCEYRSIPYEQVEEHFLRNLSWLVESAPPGDAGERTAELEDVETHIDVAEDYLENLLSEAHAGPKSGALARRIREVEDELDSLRERARDLSHLREATSNVLVQKRMRDLVEAASEPLNRDRLNLALRQVVDSITIDAAGGALSVNWKHDRRGTTMFLGPRKDGRRRRQEA